MLLPRGGQGLTSQVGEESPPISTLSGLKSHNLAFECEHSVPLFTQKLGLFHDMTNTSNSGASVISVFTLLMHMHFHNDVLAHAAFHQHVEA
jgi:hypothetical protein